jgi:hypothetical protein
METDTASILAAMPGVLEDFFHDAERMAWVMASIEAAKYMNEHLHEALVFKGANPKGRKDPEGRLALLTHALDVALESGLGRGSLIAEFGVHRGVSITHLANTLTARASTKGDTIPTRVHGFDSFEGLPGDWYLGRKAGKFNRDGVLPDVPSNVRLHKGWFADTLPTFLENNDGPAALLHLDADIYSSTKTVLDAFSDAGRIRPGTVLVFDEYFNYPGWKEHEYKACMEWVAERKVKLRYFAQAPCHYSVAVRVESIGK